MSAGIPGTDGALGGELQVRRLLPEGDGYASGAVQVGELLERLL